MGNDLAPNYPTYQPPGAMLGMVSGVQGIQAQQMQNQLTAGKLALGKIMQANINPDGSINQQGVMEALKNTPGAVGTYAQQAFLEGQQRPTAVAGTQAAQAGANLAQLKQHMAHMDALFQLAGAAKTPSDLAPVLKLAVQRKAITPQQAADVATAAPTDPAKFTPWIQSLRQATMGALEQQHAVLGTPAQVDAGSSVLSGTVSPTGQFTPTTAVGKALSPGQSATEVPIMGPGQTPGVQPLPQVLREQGASVPTQPTVTQLPTGSGAPTGAQEAAMQATQAQLAALRRSGAGGMPLPQNALTAPSAPGAPPAPNALMGANGQPVQAYQDPQSAVYARLVQQGWTPAQAAEQALAITQRGTSGMPAGAPPGFVATGLSPQAQVTLQSNAKQAADLANSLEAAQADIPQQRNNLEELRAQIAQAKPGPVSGILAHYGSLWNEMIGGAGAQATAKMLADKGTSWVVQASSQHMGVPTDGKMGLLLEGTPNTTMTKQAAETATGMLMGNLDYLSAKNAAWNAYKESNPANADFTQFQQQWNQHVPTSSVFQFQHISPSERAIYWRSLSPKGREQFIQAAQYTGTLPQILADLKQNGR